jgi:hypothetical protein
MGAHCYFFWLMGSVVAAAVVVGFVFFGVAHEGGPQASHYARGTDRDRPHFTNDRPPYP